jgi:hypothetical protein
MNGLGCPSRDTGHNRVPAPPESMTGININYPYSPYARFLSLDLTMTIVLPRSDVIKKPRTVVA